jgi:hypothetical protein
VLKRKLNGLQIELQELKEKNRKLENESATLVQKCRDLENELETSWMDDVDTNCVEVAELNKTPPVESDVPGNSRSSGTNTVSKTMTNLVMIPVKFKGNKICGYVLNTIYK